MTNFDRKLFAELGKVVLVCLIAGTCLHECRGPGTSGLRPHPGDEVETLPYYDTIRYYDTIPYYLPVAKQEVSLGTRVVYVPVFSPGEKAAYASQDSTEIRATGSDTETTRRNENRGIVAVEIPITQKEYEGAEYHAWVSGYEPSLDSIFVFPRREVVTIREPPNKQKRWGIGVFAGYGVTPQGLQPCAGISINYNLWNF